MNNLLDHLYLNQYILKKVGAKAEQLKEIKITDLKNHLVKNSHGLYQIPFNTSEL